MQPMMSIEAQPYWDGLQAGQLRVQRCGSCGQLRHYPRPMCPACQSFEVDWVVLAGHGTVHSWTRPHQSALPGFADQVPYTLVTVDMAEGVRLLGRLLGACRAWGVASEKRPQRGQFLPDLQAHSSTMGQKTGVLEERRSQKWTAEAASQPTIPKSDRLLDTDLAGLCIGAPVLAAVAMAPSGQPQPVFRLLRAA